MAYGLTVEGYLSKEGHEGAAGIQVGTLFAYCDESGLEIRFKAEVLKRTLAGETEIFTDPKASPTGFPFKIVSLPESLSEEAIYNERERVCDLGYLRELYRQDDGNVGYRCASERLETFVAKGGKPEETVGRKCLCNDLMASVGLGQLRQGAPEQPLLTSGDELLSIGRFLKGNLSYGAAEVIDYLLGRSCAMPPLGEVS